MVATSRGPSPHPPPQPLPRPGQLPEHCLWSGMCSSAPLLFHTSSGPVRYLCYLSQAPCLEHQQAFPHFPPKAGLGGVCKPKASPPRVEPGWRSPTAQECFYLRKEQAFQFLFSHLAASLGGTPLLLAARSRCRCKAAARRDTWKPQPRGCKPAGKEQYKRLFVQSHSKSVQRVILRTGSGAADKGRG